MSRVIHPTAIVHKDARIASNVGIGAYCVIGPHVSLGEGVRLGNHVVIDGYTTIGPDCQIFSGACLGEAPQDKKFGGFVSYLKIGSHNVIREHVTIHPGSLENSETIVGDHNYLMIGMHVGHDCKIGNYTTITNAVLLAGFVQVEDYATIGGGTGVHQFVRIGKGSMTGGLAKVIMDIPPFCMADGHPASVRGINAVGLRRLGFTSAERLSVKSAIKDLLMSGNSLSAALEKMEKNRLSDPHVAYLVGFIRESKRGIARGRIASDPRSEEAHAL